MNGTADLMTALRVVGSIVVVLVLFVLSARLARRAGVRGPGSGLKVLDRTGLTREASVAVIEVAGKTLVLGVTSHGVNVLAELDPRDVARAQAASAQRGPLPRVVRIPSAPADPPTDCARQDGGRQDGARQDGARQDGARQDGARQDGARQDGARQPLPADLPRARDPRQADPRQAIPRQADGRQAGRRQTVPPQAGARPANGSVLSPATWRQGIEALRDLTARKGRR